MNKTIIRFVCALIFASLVSCSPVFTEKPDSAATEDRVQIRITAESGNTPERSVLPVVSRSDITWYELWGTKSSADEYFIAWSGDLVTWGYDNVRFVEIPVGTWNFTLKGIFSEDPDADEGDSICEGVLTNVVISKTYSGSLNFNLAPVKAGTGSVFIDIELPSNSGVASVITTIDGEELDPPLEIIDGSIFYDEEEVDAGDYLFNFELKDADDRTLAVITEIVVVRQNLESQKQIVLREGEINGRPAAPSGFSISSYINNTLTLTWSDNSYNESGFVLNNGAQDYSIAANTTTYSFSASFPPQTYRLKAINDFGESTSVECHIIELPANSWYNNTIAQYENQYYCFLATAGVTYNLKWNDSYAGDYTKTADVLVSAYRSDTGASLFTELDSSYSSPSQITPLSESTYVVIKVSPYINSYSGSSSSGTYAISYY
jgi:hypothetical protein